MNKNLIIAIVASLVIHFLILFSLKEISLSNSHSFSAKNGVAKTQISIKVLQTVKKVPSKESHGNKENKQAKESKQKRASSASRSKETTGDTKAISRYLTAIRTKIVANQYKSRIAKRLRQSGVVKVSFKINSPNTVSQIKLLKPSKYKQLNFSAIQTIENLNNFPAIPKELELSELSVQIDITYP